MLRRHFPCCEHIFPCANTFSKLRTPFPMLRTLFHVVPPSLLSWDSVHVACDVASLWRTCCKLVASMLRPISKHRVATLFPCCAPLPPPPT
jgi:hypothetical protein